MNEDFRRECRLEALSGQQVRPEGKDPYSEASGESKEDSTVDPIERSTPFKLQLE